MGTDGACGLLFCLPGSKIAKKIWDTLPQETCAVIIEGISAPNLSTAFLGKQHVYTAGEAIVWAAALGPACAARAALVAKPVTPPWRRAQRHLSDCRVFSSHGRGPRGQRGRRASGQAPQSSPLEVAEDLRAADPMSAFANATPLRRMSRFVEPIGVRGGILQFFFF
jgi:hypothetical protein